jgi:hypothetical protein
MVLIEATVRGIDMLNKRKATIQPLISPLLRIQKMRRSFLHHGGRVFLCTNIFK